MKVYNYLVKQENRDASLGRRMYPAERGLQQSCSWAGCAIQVARIRLLPCM